MATILGSMVTNIKGILPILLFYLFIVWSCKIMGQTKNIVTFVQVALGDHMTD